MTWLRNRLNLGLAMLAVVAAGALAYAGDRINPNGRPAGTHPGAVERYSLWHDKDGWHLRTMTKEHEHRFRGHIACKGGKMVDVDSVRLEGRGHHKDRWVLGPEHHHFAFDFQTKGGEDGVDWKVAGKDATLTFKLEIGPKDAKFESDRIFIGKDGAHPTSDPFELPAHPGRD